MVALTGATPQIYDPDTPLWDIPIRDIAIQWTLMEMAMYQSIPMMEFLDKAWSLPRYSHLCVCWRYEWSRSPDLTPLLCAHCRRYTHANDHIRGFIDRFNASSMFVTATVVHVRSLRRAHLCVMLLLLLLLLLLLPCGLTQHTACVLHREQPCRSECVSLASLCSWPQSC